MNQLKCKIVSSSSSFMGYIVIDKDKKIITKGCSSSESWVINDAGGFHTKDEFNKLYGKDNWVVDFSDMYSEEETTGELEPNVIIEVSK